MEIESHIEQIRCPVCNIIQDAKVLHTAPWWSYSHECIKCGYLITESEWEVEEVVKHA